MCARIHKQDGLEQQLHAAWRRDHGASGRQKAWPGCRVSYTQGVEKGLAAKVGQVSSDAGPDA